jgi:hypothetical protein
MQEKRKTSGFDDTTLQQSHLGKNRRREELINACFHQRFPTRTSGESFGFFVEGCLVSPFLAVVANKVVFDLGQPLQTGAVLPHCLALNSLRHRESLFPCFSDHAFSSGIRT